MARRSIRSQPKAPHPPPAWPAAKPKLERVAKTKPGPAQTTIADALHKSLKEAVESTRSAFDAYVRAVADPAIYAALVAARDQAQAALDRFAGMEGRA